MRSCVISSHGETAISSPTRDSSSRRPIASRLIAASFLLCRRRAEETLGEALAHLVEDGSGLGAAPRGAFRVLPVELGAHRFVGAELLLDARAAALEVSLAQAGQV